MSEKLDETRKYFTIYNALVRKLDFLKKEEGLIASLHTNFAALKVRERRRGGPKGAARSLPPRAPS